jgi:hypothetical protein
MKTPRRSSAGPFAAATLALLIVAGCGDPSSQAAPVPDKTASVLRPTASESAGSGPATDWPRFGYDAARSNSSRSATGIPASVVPQLRRKVLHVNGTVDSSPIYLHSVPVRGRRRDVFIVTTTYGRTIALEAHDGHRLWEYVSPGTRRLTGTAQITTASPVADPGRRYVYAASPDGRIRKLSIGTGHEVRRGGWPAAITRDATHEKIASALNLSGGYVYAVTGGYVGDAPPYQGHVVALSRSSGRLAGVFNSLCSNRHGIIQPSSCSSSDSAIWARAGAVIEPGTGRVVVSTGNGPFNGHTDWSDSLLELTPRVLHLRQNYTPRNQEELESTDADLGSTTAALLPAPGSSGRIRYALQGGKDGKVRLLAMDKLNQHSARAGGTRGGELQTLTGHEIRFAAPAVLRRSGHVFIYTANGDGTQAYELRGHPARLHTLWTSESPGSSPVLAGGLVWVYDVENGALNVYRPGSSHRIAHLPAASGHWNSPIVAGGRVLVPEGSANSHSSSGTLSLYFR